MTCTSKLNDIYLSFARHTCLLFSFLITGWPHSSGELARLIFFRYALSEWFLFLTVGSLIVTLWITEIVRSEFTSFWDMILFSAIYVPYLILQGTMGKFAYKLKTYTKCFTNHASRYLRTLP